MSDHSPFVPAACLPGIDDAWDVWTGQDHDSLGCDCDICSCGPLMHRPSRFDARIPAHRDFLARALAGVVGVPVGATAPEWWGIGICEWLLHCPLPHGQYAGSPPMSLTDRRFVREPPNSFIASRYPGLFVVVPPLSAISIDSPDRDALALAVVVRWAGEEVLAGRIADRRRA